MRKKKFTTPLLVLLVTAHGLLAQRADIGMNLGMPWYDYDPLKAFADAVKQARGFADPGNHNLPVAKDDEGWPLADAGLVMFHGAARMAGTYRLYFTTQNPAVDARTVEVRYEWTDKTVSNETYDEATNTVSCDVTVQGNQLNLVFINTQGGVRDVKFMRPIEYNGAQSYDTSVTFTTPALELCSKFGALRFMQVANTLSDNMVAQWSDRTRRSYSCQQSRTFGGGGSAGVAWEYIIQLCNETGANLYACIPFLADDGYIDSLARLIQNELNPDLKVYLEYSNELWNGHGDYDMHRNHDAAIAEVNQGDSPLNYDGSTNDWIWAWRRAAKRGLEISAIFREVFGDDAMMTRVRPLLMTQQGDGQGMLSETLLFLLHYYNNPEHVDDPHPPNYYFYGAGGAPYYGASGDYNLENYWTSGDMDTSSFAQSLLIDIKLCATYGLKRVGYEGGHAAEAQNPVQVAAWSDSRMTTAVIDHHDAWSRYGGDLFTYFTLTGWGVDDLRYSFLTNVDSANTPKMNAIDSLNAREPQAVAYGAVPPCIIDGDSIAAKYTPLYDQPSSTRAGQWYSYAIRVEQEGVYGVSVRFTAAADGRLRILADGAEIGAPSFTSGAQSTPVYTAAFTPGLHGFIVWVDEMGGGRLSIEDLDVTLVDDAPAVVRRRTAARTAEPSLRVYGNQIVVNPGASGAYVISTLDGRVISHGNSLTGSQANLHRRVGNGVYVLKSRNGCARGVLVR
ncbi:MAG: hypothetical protein GF331_03340 [Chitinivibrionales bacterium]|nr:hypothetical protein [Chitinivibrionales bacterium]